MSKHETLVPAGAAFHPVTGPVETRKYSFLTLPGFTLLAFSSAVEPLRIANQLSQQPLYQWRVVSQDGQPVPSSSGIPIVADTTLDEIDPQAALFVCSGNLARATGDSRIPAALQRHHRFGGLVGGICTGAQVLAQAGLLRARRFTLHWENQPAFMEQFPDLVPSAAKFEIDGRIITCGGGAAATDMMLSIIAMDYGPHFAAMVSEMCLRHVMIGTEKAQRSSLGAVLHTRNPALIEIVGLMSKHLEDLLTMDELATATGYSRRHIERVFKAMLGVSPASYYRKLRLDHGRNLLSTTEMRLTDIAAATGFETVSHFSKAFRAQFGSVPSKLGYRSKSGKRPTAALRAMER